MNDGFTPFVFGVALGVMVCLIWYSMLVVEPYEKLIQQCEAELPRTQHCKLVAVPEVEE